MRDFMISKQITNNNDEATHLFEHVDSYSKKMRWSEILQKMVEDDQDGTPMRWSKILQCWVEDPATTGSGLNQMSVKKESGNERR